MAVGTRVLDIKKLSLAGFLISIGIVFGDIGTSPLYTYTAIIGNHTITELLAFGGVSAIFWTLTFQTTIKYVFITLRADNKGEGGIFSLYTLIRKYRRWLVFPAIAGGSFLLADSIITPPISVSSAIEGLKPQFPNIPIMPLVIGILVLLFVIQRKGTSFLGKLFGPIMMIWFTMIAILGLGELIGNLSVFKALNPYYAYKMLSEHPGGFWLLGGVFLCRKVVEEMVKNKEVNINSRYSSLDKHNITGDFRFVVMQRFLSVENELSFSNDFILKAYFLSVVSDKDK
jgi:KUP system potassium uptake protein